MGFLDSTGITTLVNKLKTKFQPVLVSGTNIKTINNTSLLGNGDISIGGQTTWYGTSSTSASTQTKTSTITGYTLQAGALVSITFSKANTYSSNVVKLNVNSTGAKDIYYNGAVTSSSNKLLWDAGDTLLFVYSGSYYYLVGRNKAYTLPTASTSVLGGVKVDGSTVTINASGVISASGGGGGGNVTLSSSETASYAESIVNYASGEVQYAWSEAYDTLTGGSDYTVDIDTFANMVTMCLGDLYYMINNL